MSQPSARKAPAPGRSRQPVPPHLRHHQDEPVGNEPKCGIPPVRLVHRACG